MLERDRVSARGMVAGALLGAAALALLCAATASAKPHCAGKKATIVGTPHNDRLVAHGPGRQVIAGLGGNDKIVTKGGADIACGGAGNDSINLGSGNDKGLGGGGDDTILGGAGSDIINGDAGNDTIDGGDGKERISGGDGNDAIDGAGAADPSLKGDAGNDEILGGPGSDLLDGGPGADRLNAGLQDDSLLGGDGNDVVVGGHGVDDMNGGAGDDVLRGGLNVDAYNGSTGTDTASFATATPPGPTDSPNVSGVKVTLNSPLGTGSAFGDEGGPEPLSGIESVTGTAFDDDVKWTGGTSPGRADGGGGSDTCSGFATTNCPSVSPRVTATIYVAGRAGPDPGLVLLGGADTNDQANDHFTVAPVAGGVQVTYSGQANLVPGAGCNATNNPGEFLCTYGSRLGYVLGWGEGGDDSFQIGAGFDPAIEIVLDGGTGDDTLTGGPTSEEMLPGVLDQSDPGGNDILKGNGGDDALFARGADADTLNGGDGNDQFVVDNACSGSHMIGGPGDADVAGFGSETQGVNATLGGEAFRSAVTGQCPHTKIGSDNEVLEGSSFNDILHGDGRDNPLILGRSGNDEIYGGGGDDFLRGMDGSDELYGEAGADTLDALDGRGDSTINCGPGGATALRDSIDPPATGC